MLVYLFLILLIVFMDLKAAGKNEFCRDYLSKERTAAINGVFVLLVFLTHAVGYVKLSGPLDAAYLTMKGYLRQMIVSTFLFYSGYGMLESIKKKGMAYVLSIPGKRFLKVFLHMEIAVALFLLTDVLIGADYGKRTTLLAFTFWESIGNSNWYIFAILCLYLIVFLSFLVCRANPWVGTALTTALSVGYVYLLIRVGKDTWWYNTVMLYCVGMWYSLLKPWIEKVVMKNDVTYFLTAGVLLAAYYPCFKRRDTGIEFYTLWGACFILLLVLLTMKLNIGNTILGWFGSHVFSIYILQRIPMIVLRHFGLNANRYSFITLSFLATLVLAVLFDVVMERLDGLLFRTKTPAVRPPRIETAN